jgi:hypothetical protein
MKTIDILIIITIIVFLGFILTYKSSSDNKLNKSDETYEDEDTYEDDNEEYDYLDKIIKSNFNKLNIYDKPHHKYNSNFIYDSNYNNNNNNNNIENDNNNVTSSITNPYFVPNQFHTEYKDILTAFDMIVPSNKPLFNRSMLATSYTVVPASEVSIMIKTFIKTLNKTIKFDITDYENVNRGWKNIMPNYTCESGWERQMKVLGLPPNLYNTKLVRSKVKIIKIDKVDKFATDSQIQYQIYMIIQKITSEDQLVIKVNFVLPNIDYSKYKDKINLEIENIYVVGFLTTHSYGSTAERSDFYSFENIEKDNMLNQKEIIEQLKEKYANRQIKSNDLTIQHDPQTENNLAMYNLTTSNEEKFGRLY